MHIRTILKIIVFLFIFTYKGSAIQFRNLTEEDGLSSNWVYCITQDNQGFMWFGTDKGLDRWDGVNVHSYKHDPTDSNSLSSSDIKRIYQDSDGIFWIGTTVGLDRYDPVSDTFSHYFFEKEYSENNWVIRILAQGDSILWLGTKNGLVRFQKDTGHFQKFFFRNENGQVINKYRQIWALSWIGDDCLVAGTRGVFFKFDTNTYKSYEFYPGFKEKNWGIGYSSYRDSEGLVWLCFSNGGVFCYDPKNEAMHRYINNADTTYINYPCIVGITEDRYGDIWLASLGGGLHHYNKRTKKFRWFTPKLGEQGRISTSITIDVFEDKQGNIWSGSYDGGVNMIPRWGKNIQIHGQYFEKKKSIGDGAVVSLCEDPDGYLWVSSMGGGLAQISQDFSQAMHLDDQNPEPISYRWNTAIELDHKKNVWLCNSYGIGVWTRETKKSEWLMTPSTETPGKIPDYSAIVSVCEDSLGNMWFGSYTEGLVCLTALKEFKYYHHDPNNPTSVVSGAIFSLMCDHSGNLWIGTTTGLSCLEQGSESFITFSICHNDTNKKDFDYIAFTTFEDSRGLLWLGTDRGLYILDRENNQFVDRTSDLGIAHQEISTILEDQSADLWIQSATHLYRFNVTNNQTREFGKKDGFIDIGAGLGQNRNFILGRTGHIYYGGNKRVIRFHPDSILINPEPPPVVFTSLEINYKKVKPGKNEYLEKTLNYTDSIVLPYSVNSFSVGFAALDYTLPQNNQYAYMLEGFHNEWVDPGALRKAVFTGLQPGHYTLRVKASNNDGVWNEQGASLKIYITPPWWRTTLAYFVWTVLFIGVFYFFYRMQLKRARFKQRSILEHEQVEKLQEIDRLKSTFFANISHELRTPLTLILGPVDDILKQNINDQVRKNIDVMHRNGKRLLRLINQLLDFSKLEAGTVKLSTAELDLVAYVKRIVASFMSAAERNNIRLEFKAKERTLLCYFDAEKLETIVANILSNAFKFTPEGGHIVVRVERQKNEKGKFCEITIQDSGIGIPEDELSHIFDRFYQIDDSQTRKHEGAGIGLALAKEMAELHHGTIEVESQPCQGSLFTVRLPLGRTHLKDDEISKEPIEETIFEPRAVETSGTDSQNQAQKKSKPLVLLVEDNHDVRFYIRDLLSGSYNVREAQNGVQGLDMAIRKSPDLIISDVMMPEMDGFELCEKIKTDGRTSHIPIILLTARADESDKLSGLETGADDYIIKPFSAQELKIRVNNLIEQRKRLRETFSRKLDVDPSEITVTSMDREFLNRAIKIVEEHMAHSSFSIEFLARRLGLSRMHLHRKIKALTDLTASQFVLLIRLKRAAQLLEERAGTVTEIAYQVGFENPSYFSACFRKQFGVRPSEYLAS